jgi:hypothetical protein
MHCEPVLATGEAIGRRAGAPLSEFTCRVPHLRDGIIVAKVGHRAKRDTFSLLSPIPSEASTRRSFIN